MTDSAIKCRFCRRTDPNLQSSRQHERLAHIEEYNISCQPAARTKARWTAEESYRLAREEARLLEGPNPPRFINQAICGRHVVDRTLDSVKAHRKTLEHRALVVEARSRLVNGARGGIPPPSLPPAYVVTEGESDDLLTINDETEVSASGSSWMDDDSVSAALRSALRSDVAGLPTASYPPTLAGAIQGLLSALDNEEGHLVGVVERLAGALSLCQDAVRLVSIRGKVCLNIAVGAVNGGPHAQGVGGQKMHR